MDLRFDAYEIDSRSFSESICMPESMSIHGRGGHHKLLLF
jgi:hypothetical protein